MSKKSTKTEETEKIKWSEETWNPVTGCTPYSTGCKNCYAKKDSTRNYHLEIGRYIKKHNMNPNLNIVHNNPEKFKYRNRFDVTLHPYVLDEPFKYKKPLKIFVCSMSDLFHKDVPFSFIDDVMKTIEACQHHTFQILTKRAERMNEYFSTRKVPKNTWIGVTIDEKHSATMRLKHLRKIKTDIKFLSCEPLVEDLGKLDLKGIKMVSVGRECGNKREMKIEWLDSVVNQCNENNVDVLITNRTDTVNIKPNEYNFLDFIKS